VFSIAREREGKCSAFAQPSIARLRNDAVMKGMRYYVRGERL